MLFLPHLSGSALDMIQKYGHHFYTAPVNTTTTGLPLKGRQFLFSFLFCWYKQHCCVMYPIIITFTQYCVLHSEYRALHAELNLGSIANNILILESHQIRLVWLLSKWEKAPLSSVSSLLKLVGLYGVGIKPKPSPRRDRRLRGGFVVVVMSWKARFAGRKK